MTTTTTTTETRVRIKASAVNIDDFGATVEGIRFVYTGTLPWGVSPLKRYILGFSPNGMPARKVFQGPEVTELFGWLNPVATVIAAHVIPEQYLTVEVAEGTLIEVEGHGTFRVGLVDHERRPGVEVVA